MPYQRTYDKAEVKGMLMIAEGSANILAFKAYKVTHPTAKFANAPGAHAGSLHANALPGDMSNRVAGGGPTHTTGSFKTFEMMVDAVTDALNGAAGQAALGALDGGANEQMFDAPLTAGIYFGSRASRYDIALQGATNKVKKVNVLATPQENPFMCANEIKIKIVRYIAGRLWIQTAYPSRFDMAPVPATLAALP